VVVRGEVMEVGGRRGGGGGGWGGGRVGSDVCLCV
jgi:hypothetical protein